MKDAVIVSIARTAVGKAPRGTLRSTRPDDMAAAVLKEVIRRVPGLDPKEIEDVILGCAMPEGRTCKMTHGAREGLSVSKGKAEALGWRPRAGRVSFATAGCLPEEMGLGPVFAVPKALRLAGLSLADVDVIELNEAFAVQSLAVMQEAGLDPERTNVNGGALALGHPLGCTGAKLTATLLGEMKRRRSRYGMGPMCVGGGMGAAGRFEKFE